MAGEDDRHKEHFVCVVCGSSLLGTQYHEHEGSPYCHADFMGTFAHRCAGCKESVFGAHLTALDQHWHTDCFVCTTCRQPFASGRYFTVDNMPYCSEHYHSKVITDNHVSALGASWHAQCFNCSSCGSNLTGTLFASRKGKAVCKTCANAVSRKRSQRIIETLNDIRASSPARPAPAARLPDEVVAKLRDLGKAYARTVRTVLTAVTAEDVGTIKSNIAAAVKPVKDLIGTLRQDAATAANAEMHASTLQTDATALLTHVKAVFSAKGEALVPALALLKKLLVKLTGDVNAVVSSMAATNAPGASAAEERESESESAARGQAVSSEPPKRASAVLDEAPSVKSMLDQQLRSFLVENAELCIYLTQAGADVDDVVPDDEADGGDVDPKAILLVRRMLRSMTAIAATTEVLDELDWTGPQSLAAKLVEAAKAGRVAVRAEAERAVAVQRCANELRELIASIVGPYLDPADEHDDSKLEVKGPMGLNHRLESFGVGTASHGAHSRFITDWQDASKFEPKAAVKHNSRRAATVNLSSLDVDFDSPEGQAAVGAMTAASAANGGSSKASGRSGRKVPVRKGRDRPLPSAKADLPGSSKRNKQHRRRAVSMSLSLLTTARLSASIGSVQESIQPFELELPTAAATTVETQERSRVLDIQKLMGDLGDILESEDLSAVAYTAESLDEVSSESGETGVAVATPVSAAAATAVTVSPTKAGPSSPASASDAITAREVVLLPRSKRENVEERLVDEDTAASGAAYLPETVPAVRTARSPSISANGKLELHPPTSGKLVLKRGMFNKWKRRHFLLENAVLYFMKLNGRTVIDRLPVPGCAISRSPETSHSHAFSLTTPEAMGGDVVVFRAEDAADKSRWVNALESVAAMPTSCINEALMRPVTKKQSRMTLRKGKSFSLAAGLAAAGLASAPTLVKRKAILEGETEVLVYINNKVEAGTPEKLISLLVSESDPPPGYETVFLLCFRHAIKPKFVLETVMGRFNCVAPAGATGQQLAYVSTWRPIIQTRAIDFVMHWVENNWYDFHDDEVMVMGVMNFVSLVREVGDSDDIRARAEQIDALIEAKITEFDGYKEAKLEGPSGGIAHEWGKLVEYDAVELARNYTLFEMEKFVAVRPEEFTVQMWGDKSKGFLRVYSENLSAFVDSFNHVSYWVASEICLMPDLKKRVAILKHIITLGKEFYDHRNFNGLMAVISGLNLASVQRLKKTWAGLPSKSLATLHQLEAVMSPKSNYAHYRDLLSDTSPAVPFFGLLLKDLTFLDDGNPKRIDGTALVNFDKWRTIATAILSICKFQDSEFDFVADDDVTTYLKSCLIVDDRPLYSYSLLCEPRGQAEDSASQRLIEKWAAAS
ncbi:uncharacterized protein AMSG_01497 [Thecamonas trahens ATCC 50062]|uniref:Uncharacterized protein n=1 Tax=Thecamonas trahens ATCC 50062 TaxID=461836 RepID=A0A0L0DQS5_THETB|nr:hypothetical protein AMSG_01497 [Thecamonas trahens ATCC 50062]KNC54644.1 hypothetical protein AMSG_01497 [Thecamonas trahens ATCC 50062]|eukprot:XP_013761549.1 hypothetical protein AMSG_01497 [Thecamonas trahens ATCC 50062]